MISACPYCFQNFDTLGKVEEFTEKGESCTNPCPKCGLLILFTPAGVEQIPSELEKHPRDDRSCRTLAHNM